MYKNLFLVNISSVSYCFECKKGGRREISKWLDPIIGVCFKFVNVEIFVESPIIAHRREYPGTHSLKSIPTRSHQKGYFVNTTSKVCYELGTAKQASWD